MKIKFLLIILFFNSLLFSQKNYLVKYKMTTLFDGLKNYEAKLIFSENKSYFEYNLSLKDTATVESLDEDGNFKIIMPDKRTQKIYFDFYNKKSVEMNYLKRVYYVQEDIKFPDWFIFDEVKTINNHLCRKASAFYKGRDYEVWFTDEYPINYGPWKLNGLPGLIIVAQDKKGEVYFEATDIVSTTTIVDEPGKANKIISSKEYQIEIQKHQKNIEERLKAMSDRDTKIDIKFGKNNSIEITE